MATQLGLFDQPAKRKMPAHEPIDFGGGRYDFIKEILISIEPYNNGFIARLNITSEKGYELNASDWRKSAEQIVKAAYFGMVVDHLGLTRWQKLPATLLILGGAAPSPRSENEVMTLARSLRVAYEAPKVDLKKWVKVQKGPHGAHVVIGAYPVIVKSDAFSPKEAKENAEETIDAFAVALKKETDSEAATLVHLTTGRGRHGLEFHGPLLVTGPKTEVENARAMLREIIIAMRQGKKPGERADHQRSDYF